MWKINLFIALIMFFHPFMASTQPSNWEKVNFSIYDFKDSFGICQPIPIQIKIENTNKDTTEIYSPNITAETITFDIYNERGDKQPQLIWVAAIGKEKIKLFPQQELIVDFELTEIYPFLFESGKYKLEVNYQVSESVWLKASVTTFVLPSLSEAEEKARMAYRPLTKSGGIVNDAVNGPKFLEEFPNSIFSNKVRIRTGLALKSLGQIDESEVIYQQLISSDTALPLEKTEAFWHLTKIYEERGSISKALEYLEQIDTSLVNNIELNNLKKRLLNKKKK